MDIQQVLADRQLLAKLSTEFSILKRSEGDVDFDSWIQQRLREAASARLLQPKHAARQESLSSSASEPHDPGPDPVASAPAVAPGLASAAAPPTTAPAPQPQAQHPPHLDVPALAQQLAFSLAARPARPAAPLPTNSPTTTTYNDESLGIRLLGEGKSAPPPVHTTTTFSLLPAPGPASHPAGSSGLAHTHGNVSAGSTGNVVAGLRSVPAGLGIIPYTIIPGPGTGATQQGPAAPHLLLAAERERRLALSAALARQQLTAEAERSVRAQDSRSSEHQHMMQLMHKLVEQNEQLGQVVQLTQQQLTQQQLKQQQQQRQQARPPAPQPTVENDENMAPEESEPQQQEQAGAGQQPQQQQQQQAGEGGQRRQRKTWAQAQAQALPQGVPWFVRAAQASAHQPLAAAPPGPQGQGAGKRDRRERKEQLKLVLGQLLGAKPSSRGKGTSAAASAAAGAGAGKSSSEAVARLVQALHALAAGGSKAKALGEADLEGMAAAALVAQPEERQQRLRWKPQGAGRASLVSREGDDGPEPPGGAAAGPEPAPALGPGPGPGPGAGAEVKSPGPAAGEVRVVEEQVLRIVQADVARVREERRVRKLEELEAQLSQAVSRLEQQQLQMSQWQAQALAQAQGPKEKLAAPGGGGRALGQGLGGRRAGGLAPASPERQEGVGEADVGLVELQQMLMALQHMEDKELKLRQRWFGGSDTGPAAAAASSALPLVVRDGVVSSAFPPPPQPAPGAPTAAAQAVQEPPAVPPPPAPGAPWAPRATPPAPGGRPAAAAAAPGLVAGSSSPAVGGALSVDPISDDVLQRVLFNRQRFIRHRAVQDGDLVSLGLPAPGSTEVVEDVADMLLEELLLEQAQEMAALCDSVGEQLFDGEFRAPPAAVT